MKIRVGVAGYGNLGRAVINDLQHFSDMELKAVFSRRPSSIKLDVPVYALDDAAKYKDDIDVLILCGGSATDLPKQSPELAKHFSIVDSFDTHADINEHFDRVNTAAKSGGNLAAISVGWDPGMFSIMRSLFSSVLPTGHSFTFWGKGVSQGHSDAIRRIEGVKKGIQYTIPKNDALKAVREGKGEGLTVKDKHLRECFVVADKSDEARIEKEIVTMPNYFADYDTVVHFITEEEFDKNHIAIPHGGFVLRSGETSPSTSHLLEFSLKLDSNPEFTASVIIAFARAVYRMKKEGKTGAVTVLDVPLSYLSSLTPEELRKTLV